jgi:hypothetical protein
MYAQGRSPMTDPRVSALEEALMSSERALAHAEAAADREVTRLLAVIARLRAALADIVEMGTHADTSWTAGMRYLAMTERARAALEEKP